MLQQLVLTSLGRCRCAGWREYDEMGRRKKERKRRRGSYATRLATVGAVIIGTSCYTFASRNRHVPFGRAMAEGGRDR